MEILKRQPRVILSPQDRREAILNIMKSARRRLIFSLFRCDDFAILEEVAAAVRRHVDVRVLVTSRARNWKKRLDGISALLESTGAKVYRYDATRKYHAKYMVADDGPACVATFNLTGRCFTKTVDSLFVTYESEIVSGLQRLFECDVRTPGEHFSDLPAPFIIGPDKTRSKITELLDGARENIRIVDHRPPDPKITSVLGRKVLSGVDVQVIRRPRIGALLCHGPVFLIDNRLAVIGSISLSTASLDRRREVSIIISTPRIIRQLNEYFDGLLQWSPSILSPNLEGCLQE